MDHKKLRKHCWHDEIGMPALLARLKFESTIGSLCIFGLRMPSCGTEIVQVQAQVPLGLPCGTGPWPAHSDKPLVHLSWTCDFCSIQREPWTQTISALKISKVLCQTSQGMATWCDEDFIGKVSRTARTCHPLTQTIRTLEKRLGQYAQHWALLN